MLHAPLIFLCPPTPCPLILKTAKFMHNLIDTTVYQLKNYSLVFVHNFFFIKFILCEKANIYDRKNYCKLFFFSFCSWIIYYE